MLERKRPKAKAGHPHVRQCVRCFVTARKCGCPDVSPLTNVASLKAKYDPLFRSLVHKGEEELLIDAKRKKERNKNQAPSIPIPSLLG
jgi:hypothetical protein